jgi:putative tryptophan/tyrosine transport system substrate-binding protein
MITMPDKIYTYSRVRNGWTFIAVVLIVMILLLNGCTRSPRIYRIGILIGSDALSTLAESFKTTMTEQGYIEGKNITYFVQRSNSDPALEKSIAGKFVADKMDLVFAFPGQTARVVKTAALGTLIPVVFANAVIEGTDLVDNVRRPGGNITGVRVSGTELTLKSFESLLELIPRRKQIMVIYDPNYPTTHSAMEALLPAALSFRVTLQEVHVTNVNLIQAVLQELEKSGNANMDAIMLLQDTITRSSEASGLIIKFADAHKVPVAGGPATLVRNGAVVSATTDILDQGKLAAFIVDKILDGAIAGNIPVMSSSPCLYINYTKARKLGLTVPQGLLKQAVEIIR